MWTRGGFLRPLHKIRKRLGSVQIFWFTVSTLNRWHFLVGGACKEMSVVRDILAEVDILLRKSLEHLFLL